MTPVYPGIPARLLAEVAHAALAGKRRSFRSDAIRWLGSTPVEILNREGLPTNGPAVLVMNHYHRPGFQAWWFALAIAAAAPVELHWTMTAAWTDDGTRGAALRAVVSPLILPRLAKVYGFTSMPPMPPRPQEVEARARSVRNLLSTARRTPQPILALAPEGQDSPDGKLMRPHPGVGRMLSILGSLDYRFYPIGIYETDHLILNVGPPFALAPQDSQTRDQKTADQVMRNIALQLPHSLRGVYSSAE